jgi:hypothetical protein
MDTDNPAGPSSTENIRNQQVDNAIRAIQEKKPVPEIDFTIHTMEDGTQVNTAERVCKGSYSVYLVILASSPAAPPSSAAQPAHEGGAQSSLDCILD